MTVAMGVARGVAKIPDVDTLMCSAKSGTTHQVESVPEPRKRGKETVAVWRCIHCNKSWADLDAEFRRTRPKQIAPFVTSRMEEVLLDA